MSQKDGAVSQSASDYSQFTLRPKASAWRRFRRTVRRHPLGSIGGALILALVLIAIFAPIIAPYEPTAQIGKRLQPPSREFILGTDQLGRDVFSRIIYGSRVSLYVGVIAVGLALVIGVPIGLLAGYLGGRFDNVSMRFIDLLLAFPALVLAIVLAGLLGPSITNAMIAIGIVYAPRFTRVARGSVLSVVEEVYVEAARSIGGSSMHIMWRHVLPNIMAPLIVLATLYLSLAILTEAGLSFLGLGTQPPDPSWGIMLSSGRQYMELYPGVTVFPGLAIAITVLAFNLLGDGLRDALDPRLRE
jgi:ABC-type dipeptide/oligopeptide/nickel transport system permease subunit